MFWPPGFTFITLLAMNSPVILLKLEGQLYIQLIPLLLFIKH